MTSARVAENFPPRDYAFIHRGGKDCAVALIRSSARRAPQPFGGDLRALAHRVQFLERDVGVELAVAGEGAEAAIRAGDDPLAPDDVGEAAEALGDQFGMLDVIGGGV